MQSDDWAAQPHLTPVDGNPDVDSTVLQHQRQQHHQNTHKPHLVSNALVPGGAVQHLLPGQRQLQQQLSAQPAQPQSGSPSVLDAAPTQLRTHLEGLPVRLRPGSIISLTARLYDAQGQPVQADALPIAATVTIAIQPASPPGGSTAITATTHTTISSNLTTATDSSGGPQRPWQDARIAHLDPGPSVGGSLTVPVRDGAASWPYLSVLGWPGRYALLLTAAEVTGAHQVAPLKVEFELTRCEWGDSLDLATSQLPGASPSWLGCAACGRGRVGLWRDERPTLWDIDAPDYLRYMRDWAAAAAEAEAACLPCPAHAVCPGGAVLVPEPGYWHSAPDSALIHACPGEDGCGGGGGHGGGGADLMPPTLPIGLQIRVGPGGSISLDYVTPDADNNNSTNGVMSRSSVFETMADGGAAAAVAVTTGSQTLTLVAASTDNNDGLHDARSGWLQLCQLVGYQAVIANGGSAGGGYNSTETPAPAAVAPPANDTLAVVHRYLTGCTQAWVAAAAAAAAAGTGASRTSSNTSADASDILTASAAAAASAAEHVPYAPYAQLECAAGYTGRLCAACEPGHALSSEFRCCQCSPLRNNVAFAMFAFLCGTTLVVCTAYTNLTDGHDAAGDGGDGGKGAGNGAAADDDANTYKSGSDCGNGVRMGAVAAGASAGSDDDGTGDDGGAAAKGSGGPRRRLPGKQQQSGEAAGEPGAGFGGRGGEAASGANSSKRKEHVSATDLLKVAIVHVQYYIIITRLPVPYPASITGLQAGISAMTGAEGTAAFSFACLLPNQPSAGQARVQLLGALFGPAAVLAGSLAAWAARHMLFMRGGVGGADNLRRLGGRRFNESFVHHNPIAHIPGLGPLPAATANEEDASDDDGAGSVRTFMDEEAGPAHAMAGDAKAAAAADYARPSDNDASTKLGSKQGEAGELDSDQVALREEAAASMAAAKAAQLLVSSSISSGSGSGDSSSTILKVASLERGAPAAKCPLSQGPPSPPPPPPLLRSGALSDGSGGLRRRGGGGGGGTQPLSPLLLPLRSGFRTLSSLPHSAALQYSRVVRSFGALDACLGLRQQLGVVALVAVFVLYPSWAQTALSVFACYRIDDGVSGAFPERQLATWRHGYWIRDMQQECYTGTHLRLYVPLGVASVLLCCLAPPLASLALLWRMRGQLEEPSVRRRFGFLYTRYKRRYFWWESVLLLQELCLVAVEVFSRSLRSATHQALLLLAALSAASTASAAAAPARSRLVARLETLSAGVCCLTLTLSLFLIADAEGAGLDKAAANAVGLLILLLNAGLLVAVLALMAARLRSWPLGGRRRGGAAGWGAWWGARRAEPAGTLVQAAGRVQAPGSGMRDSDDECDDGGDGWPAPGMAAAAQLARRQRSGQLQQQQLMQATLPTAPSAAAADEEEAGEDPSRHLQQGKERERQTAGEARVVAPDGSGQGARGGSEVVICVENA